MVPFRPILAPAEQIVRQHSEVVMRLVLSIGAALLLLAPLSSIQGQKKFSGVKSSYLRAIKKSDFKAQAIAITSMVATNDPGAVEAFLETLTKLRRKDQKLEDKKKRAQDEIDETRFKRIIKPRMDAGARQETRKLVEKQLVPQKKIVSKCTKDLEHDAKVRAALRQGLRDLKKSLSDDTHAALSRFGINHVKRIKEPKSLVSALDDLAAIGTKGTLAQIAEKTLLSAYPAVRTAALNALALHPCNISEDAALSALDDDFQQVQLAALEVLQKTGSERCIAPLIARLPNEKGRIKDHIRKTLKSLTGADFHDNVALWTNFWKEWKDDFSGRGRTARVMGWNDTAKARQQQQQARSRRPGGTAFYGIQTKAKDIVYILDISGSMEAQAGGKEKGYTRMKQAVAELIGSIRKLNKKCTFNIIFYHSSVSIWKKKMQAANKKNKEEAIVWARKVTTRGRTNIFDSLELAFKIAGRGTFDKGYLPAVEAIFLLSDGWPNEGRIKAPPEILTEVRKLNKLSKLELNTIALGGANKLMQQLARQNNGVCVHVQ